MGTLSSQWLSSDLATVSKFRNVLFSRSSVALSPSAHANQHAHDRLITSCPTCYMNPKQTIFSLIVSNIYEIMPGCDDKGPAHHNINPEG